MVACYVVYYANIEWTGCKAAIRLRPTARWAFRHCYVIRIIPNYLRWELACGGGTHDAVFHTKDLLQICAKQPRNKKGALPTDTPACREAGCKPGDPYYNFYSSPNWPLASQLSNSNTQKYV